MNREDELELLIGVLVDKVAESARTYGVAGSTFRGWLEDLNEVQKEYFRLCNEKETKE